MKQSDIGIIGLGLMGRNLALNFEGRGYSVSVFDREPAAVSGFIESGLPGRRVNPASDAATFCMSLAAPRKVLLMVPAGASVDEAISMLLPDLAPGDCIIDGGNSDFRDTERRMLNLEKKDILYCGCGVSGGGEGALRGPSLMAGGTDGARRAVISLLEAVAARFRDGSPCCAWVGPGGSGHFVKMVHNGIEYGLMQAIAEAYDMMRRGLGMTPPEIADVMAEWNRGGLRGFLLGIAADILGRKADDGSPLIDMIGDAAGQKGTGMAAEAAALEMGVPAPVIAESNHARLLSALANARVEASGGSPGGALIAGDRQSLLAALQDALYCTQLAAFDQGFALVEKASARYSWGLDTAAIARIWRGGCIIQSGMIEEIAEAPGDWRDGKSLLTRPPFAGSVARMQAGWRRATAVCVTAGIPVPATASALAYYDGLRSGTLPSGLIQAMRDYFGGHGFEIRGGRSGELHHADWKK